MQSHNNTSQTKNQSNRQPETVRITSRRAAQSAGPGAVIRAAGPPEAGAANPLGIRTFLRSAEPKDRRFELLNAARELAPNERVSHCMRRRINGKQDIGVYYAPKFDKAHYSNLQSCGSVWTCPVCGAKITERRRLEIEDGICRHRAGGGGIVMLTLTTRHNRGEACDTVLDGLLNAMSDFWRGRAGMALREDFGIVCRIRSLEVTYGKNGWHPHSHILLFTERELTKDEATSLENRAFGRWLHVLGKYDREAMEGFGAKVDSTNEKVAEYVAKFGKMPKGNWNESHELAKGATKAGKRKGRTPMQLLIDYNDNQDKAAGKLWQEYAAAFKGKRQLSWTKGLRALLGLGEEKTDEELAKEQEEQAEPVAFIGKEGWKQILGNDIRAEVLHVASMGQWALRDYLDSWGIIDVGYPTGPPPEEDIPPDF